MGQSVLHCRSYAFKTCVWKAATLAVTLEGRNLTISGDVEGITLNVALEVEETNPYLGSVVSQNITWPDTRTTTTYLAGEVSFTSVIGGTFDGKDVAPEVHSGPVLLETGFAVTEITEGPDN